MDRSPADLPLNHARALEIADDLLTAVELLMESPLATDSSISDLTACADEILDLVHSGSGWIPRVEAMAIASTLLDDGYLPLYEYTLHQPLALALLEHHDHLLELVGQWP